MHWIETCLFHRHWKWQQNLWTTNGGQQIQHLIRLKFHLGEREALSLSVGILLKMIKRNAAVLQGKRGVNTCIWMLHIIHKGQTKFIPIHLYTKRKEIFFSNSSIHHITAYGQQTSERFHFFSRYGSKTVWIDIKIFCQYILCVLFMKTQRTALTYECQRQDKSMNRIS